MAEFKSKHGNLTFYHEGERYEFSSGKFRTVNVGVIKTVEQLAGVERVDKEVEPKSKVAEMFEETKPKTKEKPSPKKKK